MLQNQGLNTYNSCDEPLVLFLEDGKVSQKSFLTERVSRVSDRVMLLVEEGIRMVLGL
ncbi:hypothetical protein [Chlorogloeopsis sp. ULAP02]|uniref:hypothetical protein n=1 Tax=Chlorogloeopsis sp. ULAP02 TaxID=3107926 RepID=UPI0031357705